MMRSKIRRVVTRMAVLATLVFLASPLGVPSAGAASAVAAQPASVARSQAGAVPAPPSRTASASYTTHPTQPVPNATNYVIAVQTGNFAGAGTDGYVSVWFDGTNGRSGWLDLEGPGNLFESGSTDYFNYTLADLGTPVRCWVWFSPAGLGPDWYLNTVTINGKTFAHYGWLTRTGTVQLRPV